MKFFYRRKRPSVRKYLEDDDEVVVVLIGDSLAEELVDSGAFVEAFEALSNLGDWGCELYDAGEGDEEEVARGEGEEVRNLLLRLLRCCW